MKRVMLSIMLAAVFVSTGALGNVKNVSPDDMLLIFRGENIGLDLKKSQIAQRPDYTVEFHFQGWMEQGRYAVVTLVRRLDGSSWARIWDIEETLSGTFTLFRKKQLRWGDSGDRSSPLGPTKFHRFKADDHSCFAWQTLFTSPNSTHDDSVMFGAVCDRQGMTTELEDAVVGAAGYRGMYRPQSNPSAVRQ